MKIQRKWFDLFFTPVKLRSNFVIFTQGRTGGTLLEDLLNCHPDLCCDGELLNSKRYDGAKINLLNLTKRQDRSYLDKSYGFRLKVYQMLRLFGQEEGKRVFDRLNDSGWKIIYLKRNNILKHSLSAIRSQSTGFWHNATDNSSEKNNY